MNTGEQESAEAVLDGEGIAVAAVEHLELAFEVDGPDRIGLIHGREWLAGMARFTGSLVAHCPLLYALPRQVTPVSRLAFP